MLSPWGQQHRHTLRWAWQPWTRRQSSAVFGISLTWHAWFRWPWGEAHYLQLVWKALHRLCRPIGFGIWPRPNQGHDYIQLQKEEYYFQDFLHRFLEVSATQNVPIFCILLSCHNLVQRCRMQRPSWTLCWAISIWSRGHSMNFSWLSTLVSNVHVFDLTVFQCISTFNSFFWIEDLNVLQTFDDTTSYNSAFAGLC